MITALLSLVIFVVYLSFTLRYIQDVPESLSETYYLLGNKYYSTFPYPHEMEFNHLRASLFTFMMWAISFLLLPSMLEVTPVKWQFLAFLALASICFVGGAPQFKRSFEGKIHTISAYVAAFFGLLWSIIVADGWPFLIVSIFVCLAGSIMTDSFSRSKTFWLEMIAFGTVYLSTIFALL